MTPKAFLAGILRPHLRELAASADAPLATPEAEVILLAVAAQESGLDYRKQIGGGPGRGWWQFEAAVPALMAHPTVSGVLKGLCTSLCVPWNAADIHEAITWNDQLAVTAARLLLLADPFPLPRLEDVDKAWQCYLRTWNPGKPRPEDWAANYDAAIAAVTAIADPSAAPSPKSELENKMPTPIPSSSPSPSPESSPFKSGWRSSETWVAIGLSVLPYLADALDKVNLPPQLLQASPWIGAAIYASRQLFKAAAVIQLPAVKPPEAPR